MIAIPDFMRPFPIKKKREKTYIPIYKKRRNRKKK